MSLKGKTLFITGSSRGIGLAIALRAARDGANIAVAAKTADPNPKLPGTIYSAASEIEAAGGQALPIPTDIRDEAAVAAAVQAAVERFGGIDILVNNAFTLSPKVLLEQKTDDMLDATLHSGLWAGWWSMQAARPHMVARGGGSIINFYSIDVETAAWLNSDYNITKSALRGLTRSAAHEWGRFNIRVNLLSPAAMGTVFHRMAEAMPGFAEMAASRKPLLRNGDPEEDIAPVAVFLASDMSRFVTGEMINVDGGLHMPGYQSRPANVAELEQQGC
jgi:NAD(P)-dependent dehydrogenase (short-subunit alcohol dehydrogenase family)